MNEITLYFAPYSRSFTPRWLLEELGVPYRVQAMDLRRGSQKHPDYLAVNPMGKVPALRDGAVTVSENPAICLYLADRYGYGTLAPKIEDPARGAYLKWIVFSTAVFEPAIYLDEAPTPEAASAVGWGRRATVIRVLDEALQKGPWLLGEIFSAADVMLGSLLSIALFNNRIAAPPDSFRSYDARISARDAYKRAAQATWAPPSAEA